MFCCLYSRCERRKNRHTLVIHDLNSRILSLFLSHVSHKLGIFVSLSTVKGLEEQKTASLLKHFAKLIGVLAWQMLMILKDTSIMKTWSHWIPTHPVFLLELQHLLVVTVIGTSCGLLFFFRNKWRFDQ